jgi:hypothetical protein
VEGKVPVLVRPVGRDFAVDGVERSLGLRQAGARLIPRSLIVIESFILKSMILSGISHIG